MVYSFKQHGIAFTGLNEIIVASDFIIPGEEDFPATIGYEVSKYNKHTKKIEIIPEVILYLDPFEELLEPKENILKRYEDVAKKENFLEKSEFFLNELENFKQIETHEDMIELTEKIISSLYWNKTELIFKTTKTDDHTVIKLIIHENHDENHIASVAMTMENKNINDFHFMGNLKHHFPEKEYRSLVQIILYHCKNRNRLLYKL